MSLTSSRFMDYIDSDRLIGPTGISSEGLNESARIAEADESNIESGRIGSWSLREPDVAMGAWNGNAVTTEELRSSIGGGQIDSSLIADFGSIASTSHYGAISIDEVGRLSINVDRSYLFGRNTQNNIIADLVFLEMKVENLGDQYKTTITYIDRKNYQEVKREYFSNVSFTQEFNLNNNDKLNIEIEQYSTIKETRKDI